MGDPAIEKVVGTAAPAPGEKALKVYANVGISELAQAIVEAQRAEDYRPRTPTPSWTLAVTTTPVDLGTLDPKPMSQYNFEVVVDKDAPSGLLVGNATHRAPYLPGARFPINSTTLDGWHVQAITGTVDIIIFALTNTVPP